MAKTFENAYDAGYDAGYYGASVRNCHYGWFGTPERTKEWERGNRAGSAARRTEDYNKKKRKKLSKDR